MLFTTFGSTSKCHSEITKLVNGNGILHGSHYAICCLSLVTSDYAKVAIYMRAFNI